MKFDLSPVLTFLLVALASVLGYKLENNPLLVITKLTFIFYLFLFSYYFDFFLHKTIDFSMPLEYMCALYTSFAFMLKMPLSLNTSQDADWMLIGFKQI